MKFSTTAAYNVHKFYMNILKFKLKLNFLHDKRHKIAQQTFIDTFQLESEILLPVCDDKMLRFIPDDDSTMKCQFDISSASEWNVDRAEEKEEEEVRFVWI